MENNRHIPFNLQFFAEPPADPNADPNTDPNMDPKADPKSDPKNDPPKTPTLKELLKDKEFASEFDQHVSKAITTAKTKWDEEAKLNADELAKKKQAEAEAALNDREAKLAARELRADMVTEIAKRGLPASLIDAVSLADKEAALESLGNVEKAFRASVDAGITEKLKGNPPAAGGGTGDDAFMQNFRAAAGLKDTPK